MGSDHWVAVSEVVSSVNSVNALCVGVRSTHVCSLW